MLALTRAVCLFVALGLAGLARAEPCSDHARAVKNVQVAVGKSMFLSLDEPVSRLAVGNPEVATARLVSARGVYLLGAKVGTTNLVLQGRSVCQVVDVKVALDVAGLIASLAELLPQERLIRVSSAAESLVLSGEVTSAVAADQAVSIAHAFVRGGETKREDAARARVVNMLQVTSPQQVMLEVKVAEVSKTFLDQIGARTLISRSPGFGSVALLSDFFTGTAGGRLDIRRHGHDQFLLEAEKKDGLVRILAEPTVMAISGQEGSFLAGGKILIPVAQSNAGSSAATVTLEEKEFGVGLKFTPTVLADGRIHLRVAPEVSELSREGVGVSATGALSAGSVLPLITTRRAQTTVQLFDGQSFAIGGLIKNSATANVQAMPWLGEIPVLGLLFRSTQFQSEKTELVFVVTPHLVKPLPARPALPTDEVEPPSREGLMWQGQLGGGR